MSKSCPWNISHQARRRLEHCGSPGSWKEELPHQILYSCSSGGRDTFCSISVTREVYNNPLSLSPRQLEHDSNFPCLDADCKGVGGALLLQMSIPESRTASPSRPAGMGSCRTGWRNSSWLAVVNRICKKAHSLYKASRRHNFFHRAPSQCGV